MRRQTVAHGTRNEVLVFQEMGFGMMGLRLCGQLLRHKVTLVGTLFVLTLPMTQVAGADTEQPTVQVAAPDSLAMYGPLIDAVLREAGLKPVLNFYPTARSRLLFVSSAVDAEFFRVANLPADYPPDVMAIGPLQSVRFGMFIRANDQRLSRESAEVLWKQSLGYVRSTLALEALLKNKNIKDAAVVERASGAKMLLAGRMDVLLDSERLLLAHLNETDNTDNIKLVATVLEEPTYLLLHSKAKAFEPAIRQTVKRWLESGRWQREYKAVNQLNGLPPEMSLVKYPARQ